MPAPIRYLELRCPGCLWREVCGPAEIAAWLRKAGKLRANNHPELAVMYEVFRATAGQLACPQCGRTGLGLSIPVEDRTAWPGAALCICCGKPIPQERREAVPGVRHCASCQQEAERGQPKQEKDFCPRCGAPLEVTVVGEGRRTRYVLACTANPPCPL
jgi:hypothetical protein